MTPDSREEIRREERGERRSYLIGLALALILTAAAFGLVAFEVIGGGPGLALLALLAVAQIVVHFRFFLHIDLRQSHRDDLQLILFTALIIFLMVAGTVWILYSQHLRM